MNVELYEHLLLSFIVDYRAVPPNNTMRSQRTATPSRVVRLQQGAGSRQGSDVLRAAVGEWKAAR